MALVSGPGQVGKTTTCRNQSQAYLNWDNTDDRPAPARRSRALGPITWASTGDPWFLAEVKHARESISESLRHFQNQTKAHFAFQVAIESNYIDADCFAKPRAPLAVPARTILSQLL